MIRKQPRLRDPVTGALLDPETGALIGHEYQLRNTLPVCVGVPVNCSLEIDAIDPVSGESHIVTVSIGNGDDDEEPDDTCG